MKGFTINGFRGQEDSTSRVYVCIVILFRETVEIVLMPKHRDRAWVTPCFSPLFKALFLLKNWSWLKVWIVRYMGLSSVEFVWCWHFCCYVESFGITLYYVPDRGNIDFFFSHGRIDHSNVPCGVKEFCSDLRLFSSDFQFVSNSKQVSLLSTHFGWMHWHLYEHVPECTSYVKEAWWSTKYPSNIP